MARRHRDLRERRAGDREHRARRAGECDRNRARVARELQLDAPLVAAAGVCGGGGDAVDRRVQVERVDVLAVDGQQAVVLEDARVARVAARRDLRDEAS